MHEIITAEKVASVSILTGTGICNARCEHCAGLIFRSGAPKKDGVVNEKLTATVLRECHVKGARNLSISGSGEPTVSPRSVTKVLSIVNALRSEGIDYPSIHLYSNGIRIGESGRFARHHLPLWRSLGLGILYITVHDIDPIRNAKVYGVKNYPDLRTIVDRIHAIDLVVRANIMLSRTTVCTLDVFTDMVIKLQMMGFNAVSAWPIRGNDDQVDRSRAPDNVELYKIGAWVAAHTTPEVPVTLFLKKNYAVHNKMGQKVVLLPNGDISNKWCS